MTQFTRLAGLLIATASLAILGSLLIQTVSLHQALQPDQVALSEPVPAWFARHFAIAGPAPEAEQAQRWLWQATLQTAQWLTALSLLVGVFAMLAFRAWLRPLRRALRELQALDPGPAAKGAETEGRAAEHGIDRLALRASAAVKGLRADLALRAAQLDVLQRRAHDDRVTGLPLRHHFLASLEHGLADGPLGGAALLMLRVPQLESLNLRLGHEATDHLLRAVGHLLLTYVEQVSGARAGRLNGSDFALFLPAAGVALETAQSLRDALMALSALRCTAITAVFGGVDGLPRIASGAALAEADAALARAESGEGDGLVVDTHAGLAVAAAGAGAWREQIAAALLGDRLRLETTPKLDRHGHLVHLRCAAQLELSAGADFQPARLCRALAQRSRLLPQLDRATLQAALHAIAADGRPRCIHVALQSLESAGMVEEITAALRAMPAQAARLSIAMPSQLRLDNQQATAAAAAWRLAGARVGVELANADPVALAALAQAGAGFVIVDAQQLRGIANDGAIRAYAHSLFGLVRALGLATLVEGQIEGPDLLLAWTLGLDAASAPMPDAEGLPAIEPELTDARPGP